MTFLLKERDRRSYFEKILTKSHSMRHSTEIVLNQFEEFCKSEYKHDSEKVINELLGLKITEMEQASCDVYQAWINWNTKKGILAKTLRTYFSLLKSYLHYRGIKLADKDIKDNVDFPKIIKEEKQPLLISQIQDILKVATYEKNGLYLALLSSGMRIGEAVQIRKKDINTTQERIAVSIPAKITKTKTGRTVYISKEAAKYLTTKLKRKSDDDLIWGTNQNYNTALLAEVTTFRNYVDKLGLCGRYDSGTRKITLHSFRAYFFTKATRTHDENYAHKMTGHGGYLMEYDRLTDEEKLEMYLELEPELLVYDQTKNEEKIRKLKDANIRLADQAEKIREQEKRIRALERMYVRQSIPDWKGEI